MRPMVRAALFTTLLLLLTLVNFRASAQVEQYLGRPITDVRLTIRGQPTSEAELRNVLETRVGDLLEAARVRESIVHLMALSRFDNVEVYAQANAQGVALVYELVPLRTVRAVEFRGRLGLPESELRSQVVDRHGSSPPLGRSDDIARSLEDLYRDHGYRNPSVKPQPAIQPGSDRVTLTFEVTSGPQARVGKIDFVEADRRINQGELLRGLQLKQGGPYDQVDVTRRVSAYADSLRGKGFYEANIAVTPRYSADGTTVTLDITAARGPRVVVEFAGDPVPSERRDELVPIKRENSVDQDLLEDWSGNIERYLQAQGYRDAAVSPTRQESDDQLRIVFNVRRGSRYVIDSIDVTGNQFLGRGDLLGQLGQFNLTVGQPFVERVLEAGRAQIIGRYQSEGFTTVSAKPDVASHPGSPAEVRVSVVVRISEGPRALVNSVTFVCDRHVGACAIPDAVLRSALSRSGASGWSVAPGTPFYLANLEKAREALLLEYLSRGYRLATIAIPPADKMMSADRSRADVRFEIHEGPLILVDHILLIGNDRTKASTIRNELRLKPGEPLAFDKLAESQQRLAALGLFRRVQVTQLQRGSETKRDVLVIVQESPATSIAYGGGLEGAKRQRVDANGNAVEAIELAPRGLFDIGRRNLWGKNRSINFNGSFAVRPELTGIVGTGVREYRALGTYREPRIFGAGIDLLVTGGMEQAVRPAYSFNRRGVRAEVAHRLSSTLTVYARYALDRTRVINEPPSLQDQILLGRILPRVRLSKLSSSLVRDTRDDPLDPSSGLLASLDGEVAPQFLGSEVGVAKTLVQTFVYRQLPTKRRVVFAGGLRLGLATGFGTAERRDLQGNPVLGPDGKPIIDRVTSPPLSERFFAGGNTTVRGVAEDTLGTPATLISGFATGGGGLLILNGELRFSVWKSLAAVTFVDAGNVYALASTFQPTNLQPAVGVGLRYKSPIGPIRVDLGFNLNRRVLGARRETLTAISFGIGQAF